MALTSRKCLPNPYSEEVPTNWWRNTKVSQEQLCRNPIFSVSQPIKYNYAARNGCWPRKQSGIRNVLSLALFCAECFFLPQKQRRVQDCRKNLRKQMNDIGLLFLLRPAQIFVDADILQRQKVPAVAVSIRHGLF